MNTKTLSPRALSVIDQYFHFKAGSAVCSVPYFNNKVTKIRAALNVLIGKGSPKEIFEEVQALSVKNHVAIESIADESLKKILVDNSIGIDCSGFTYYVLNAESQERGSGALEKHISFVQANGLLGKLTASLHPVRTIGVRTFADDKNSQVILIKEIQPGDMITMLAETGEHDRNHILVIHQVEYQNFIPYKIHYSHAIAYPEDGVYGSGIKQGTIEITDINAPITEQVWIENSAQGDANRICVRAKKSKTEVRRLRWL